MNFKEHEPLRLHTTFRAGGPARFWVEATTEGEIMEAVAWAQGRGIIAGIGSTAHCEFRLF